jgi:putative intracellular protease/amidase
MYIWIKRITLTGVALLLLLGVAAYVYVCGFDLQAQPLANPATQPEDLAFVVESKVPARGRILAVVSGAAWIGDSTKRAGYELTELSRAYYVFVANGYAVDIASPNGGSPPMRKDDELVAADHAFLNDPEARRKLAATLPMAQVRPQDYVAVYFVGGKGAMFDFPGNADIQRVVRHLFDAGGIIGTVCHGSAALLDVKIANGESLLAGRRVTGFSNAEELFLLKDARALFPFLLQDGLAAQGATYVEGPMYLDHIVVDGRIVTGQNPWSTWSVAETMVSLLGHSPVARERTGEEKAVMLLQTYYEKGSAAAQRLRQANPDADRRLLLMHALVASMQWRLGDAYHFQALARP